MKKFKRKNRQKRKYVKKNELAASFSVTQTLTVGLVPFVLMAIAFFATILMYNPVVAAIPVPTIRLSSPTLPEISLPKVDLHIQLPAMPQISIPTPEFKFTMPALPEMPEMPKVVIPNVTPYFINAFSALVATIDATIQTDLQLANVLRIQVSTFAVQAAIVLDPRPLFVSVGTAINNGFVQVGKFIASTAQAIGDGLQNAFRITVAAVENGVVWTQKFFVQVGIAVIKGWNAFVWFVGTPFRALDRSVNEMGIVLSPYVTFLTNALERATSDLKLGGQYLVQGTSYVATTVEQKSGQAK